MSSQFHNRLVGTVVLAALGVIFLPDVLDGKKELKEEQFAEIPLRPATASQPNTQEMFEVLTAEEVNALEGSDPVVIEAGDEDALASAVSTLPAKETQAKADAKASKTESKPELKTEVAKADSAKVKSEPVKAEPTKAQTAKVEPKKDVTKTATKTETSKTESAKKSEVKPVIVAKADGSKTTSKTEPTKTAVTKTVKDDEIRVVSRESLKSSLTLQLGAFSNAANVKALVAQLRQKGFKAYTIPTTPRDGVLTKVFVGPDVSEAKLKKMQQDIESQMNLKGRIVPFNPLES
ncbi:SPOR domain-containing protein [Shewanella acanthi]|uniref:SPOR domain-containing protein n=1 Tax=Shewanella acanthi TaxID=2864212 RepID=UPI001C6570CE|nr:SPOR domain-containing protein [Shewanella acanthi]QYJ80021.1 SPOR domain-containing protein [Shewanella acanthi]